MNFAHYLGGVRAPRARSRHRHRLNWNLENLECRALLTVTGLDSLIALPAVSAAPLVSGAAPSGLSPSQVRAAYGFDQISLAGGVVGDGSGQTIAIVDAYETSTIAADLQMFDATYGIADPPSFTQYVASGITPADPSWSLETALDVEWAHAIAPGANIMLVSARSSSLTDLLNAVDFARNQPGVVSVSMSWGSSEFRGQTAYDSLFTTPAGHIGGNGLAGGVTFVAASGDSGAWYGAEFPSSSPNVLAVGGTTLITTATGAYSSETGWSGSGGGVSYFEREPSYQLSVQRSGYRTTPDVAFNASPSTGYSVYSTSYGGWVTVGGTSAGAPQWAALTAIVDQGLALNGKGAIGAGLTSALYAMPKTNFHDILTGSNGYSAHAGFDMVTGLGSPKANQIVAAIAGTAATKTATTTTILVAAAPSVATHASFIVSSPGSSGGSGSNSPSDPTSGVVILVPTSIDIVIALSEDQARDAAQSALAGNGLASATAEMATAGALASVAVPSPQQSTPTGLGQGVQSIAVTARGARSELAPTGNWAEEEAPSVPGSRIPTGEGDVPMPEALPEGKAPKGEGAEDVPAPGIPPEPSTPKADDEDEQADPEMSFAVSLLAAIAFYGTRPRDKERIAASGHPGGPRRRYSKEEMEGRQQR